MAKSPELAKMMKDMGVKFDPAKLGQSPKNFSWHHEAEPGLMQLVIRNQHDKTLNGGIYQHLFHPDGGKGGYSIWGMK